MRSGARDKGNPIDSLNTFGKDVQNSYKLTRKSVGPIEDLTLPNKTRRKRGKYEVMGR